ncbi:hypothetical protein Tco_1171681 [Tanacetum coccineum]
MCLISWAPIPLSGLVSLGSSCICMGVEGIFPSSAADFNAYAIHMDVNESLHACDEDVGSCIIIAGLRNRAAWYMSYSLGSFYMEVSCESYLEVSREGYLEDATDILCIDISRFMC